MTFKTINLTKKKRKKSFKKELNSKGIQFSLSLLLFLFGLNQSIAQLTLHSRSNEACNLDDQPSMFNWTGIQPDTLADGTYTDGVLGSSVGTPTLFGGAMCGDTLYRIMSHLDVGNNTAIHFACPATSSSFTDANGSSYIRYGISDFLIGEANEVTATFDFTKEYDGTVAPMDNGLILPISDLSGASPGEVMDFRVYNGATLVFEQNGITNSSQCSPLDPDGTSNGATHNFEIADGVAFTRLEIDFWQCNSVGTPVRFRIGEFEIPGLTCPIFNGFDNACDAGSSYYAWEWTDYSTSNSWLKTMYGWNMGGNVARNTMTRTDSNIYEDLNTTTNAQRAGITEGSGQAVKSANDIVQDGFSWSTDDRGEHTRFFTAGSDQTYQVDYKFAEPLTNPIILVATMNKHVIYSIEDGDGNPIIPRAAGCTPTMLLYDNHIEPMNFDDPDGAILLELSGTYDHIVFKSELESRQVRLEAQVTIGECLPDITANLACQFDLYQWKVDSLECEYLLKDGEDVFYKLEDSNFNNVSSTGLPMFVDQPIAGEVGFVQADVLAGENCPIDFVCFADGHIETVRVERSMPNGTGYLLDQVWEDQDSAAAPMTALGGLQWATLGVSTGGFYSPIKSQWDEAGVGPFDGPLDALGLPSHGVNGVASGMAPAFPDAQYGTIGVKLDDNTINCNRGSDVDLWNVQQDGWLAIPPGLHCMEFLERPNNLRKSISLFVIESDGNTVQVLEEHKTDTDIIGDYCINNPHAIFGGGWQLIRIRMYSHIGDCGIRAELNWNVANGTNIYINEGGGVANNQWDIINNYTAYIYPADSPESLTIPSNLSTIPSEIQYAIKDANNNYWVPNGNNIPTTKIDFDVDLRNHITDFLVTDCAGQPAPTTGVTCADALVNFTCDPVVTCQDAANYPLDICEILAQDPSSPLATEDCDGGGQDNATECAQGSDPSDGGDDSVATCDPSTPAPTVNSN